MTSNSLQKIQHTKSSFLKLYSLGLCLLVLYSCEETKVKTKDLESQLIANNSLYDYMEEVYLWYDEIANVDVSKYKSPHELMKAVRSPRDEWSYVADYKEYTNYNKEGFYYGIGYSQSFDDKGRLWIQYVYNDSPLIKEGITRGWIIEKIAGEIPSEKNIDDLLGPNEEGYKLSFDLFYPKTSQRKSVSVAKKAVKLNTVLTSKTFSHAGRKLAYFCNNSFVDISPSEFYNAFFDFYLADSEILICDFRYNTGGDLKVTLELGNQLLYGYGAEKKVAWNFRFNDINSKYNYAYLFSSAYFPLKFEKIYFITSKETYGACETLMHSLEPYHNNIFIVGSDTHGVPVGMEPAYFNKQYVFIPITFRMRNSTDVDDSFEGVTADHLVEDDVTNLLGDENEACLEACLNHVEKGTWPIKKKRTVRLLERKGRRKQAAYKYAE